MVDILELRIWDFASSYKPTKPTVFGVINSLKGGYIGDHIGDYYKGY